MYLADPVTEIKLKTIYATLETLQYCHFDLNEIKNVSEYLNSTLYNSKMAIYDWEGDAKMLRINLQIDGIPEGGQFYKKTFANADITKAGVIYDFIRTTRCNPGTEIEVTYRLNMYTQYNTILFRSFVQPIQSLEVTEMQNSCNQSVKSNSSDGTGYIYFYVKKYYNNYEQYPDSLLEALTRVGGLIAIFRIGILLRFLHRKKFEIRMQNELVETLENNDEKGKPRRTLYLKSDSSINESMLQ